MCAQDVVTFITAISLYHIGDTYRHSGLLGNKHVKLGSNLTKDVSLSLFSILNHYEKSSLNLSISTVL